MGSAMRLWASGETDFHRGMLGGGVVDEGGVREGRSDEH